MYFTLNLNLIIKQADFSYFLFFKCLNSLSNALHSNFVSYSIFYVVLTCMSISYYCYNVNSYSILFYKFAFYAFLFLNTFLYL